MRKTSLALAVLLALAMLLGCSTAGTSTSTEAVAPASETAATPFTSAIVEVSKYGNTYLELTTGEFLASYETGDIVTITAGDYVTTAPVVTSYSDVDNGQPLVKVDGTNVEVALSYADFAGTAGVGVGSTITIEMAEKGGYLSEYEIRHLEKSESRSDYASDEVFANFRPLSGGNLKPGLLYRSCNPALGDARAPYADSLAAKAGISYAVNLADSEESLAETMDPDSYYSWLVDEGDVILLDMGIDFKTDDFKAKLKEALLAITANAGEGPILIHCNEGKDRAGMVSAILEALAGTSMDDIRADYLKSYENYYGTVAGSDQAAAITGIIDDFFLFMNGRTFPENSVKTVVEVFLTTQVGMTEAEVAALEAAITI